MQIFSPVKLVVSLRNLHRHATYQEIKVYHSRGPQLANHKYTAQKKTGLCHCVTSVRKTAVVDIKMLILAIDKS